MQKPTKLLPADEGHLAFRNRVSINPYPKDDWRHNEWQLGWDIEEQVNPDLYDHATEQFYPVSQETQAMQEL